jgi:hypothetical protein
MKILSDMTMDELKVLLAELKATLKEVEEERLFTLGQTGLHVSGSTVKRYESEVNGLKARIEETEQMIQMKSI